MSAGSHPIHCAAIVVLTACGAPTVADDTPSEVAWALAYLETLPDMRGRALPPRAGAPRTVVMFFASWCVHCRHELDAFEKLDLGGARMVLVNAFEDYDDRGSTDDMRALLAERGIDWPVVVGNEDLRRRFDVTKIPSVFIYDEGGREIAAYRRRDRGPPTTQELQAHLSSQ